MEFNPVNQQNLPQQIAEQIRTAIAKGTLNAGDRLPTEEELARRYQVSRPTIREALKRLAAQHLIHSKRGPSGGTFISRPNIDELGEAFSSSTRLLVSLDSFSVDEIIQCRLELEQLCARLAANARSESDLERLEQALARQCETLEQPYNFCAADVAFHRALADASGNRLLSLLMYGVIEALQPSSNMIVFRYPQRELIVEQHRRLLNALQQRDADAALSSIADQVSTLSAQLDRAQREWRA